MTTAPSTRYKDIDNNDERHQGEPTPRAGRSQGLPRDAMPIQHVLIVDDEPDILELLRITLSRMGLETRAAQDVRQAKALLKQHRFDLCLTDMRLPDGDGLDLVRHIQQHCPEIPVAVITAYGSVETAVEALKAGAFDFVSKPVDVQVLRNLVNSALKLSRPVAPSDEAAGERILGDSPPMRRLKATIAKLARSQAPIHIYGESGSGKELVAREIHDQGPRATRPFVPVNCGAIPAELMESELFGHTKGSFTGATADKPGLFQAAHGGTLLLDEIAELPLAMQVKLLRAIQERAVRPVGGQREVATDVRILSASQRDLAAEVEAGRFREDLYYRINVIGLRVPPLREHPEDLPLLADHILSQLARRSGLEAVTLSDEAMAALNQHLFPGNVRELENLLERAATLCEAGTITAADLQVPDVARDLEAAIADDLPSYLEDQEKRLIVDALEATRWNKTAAAKRLGISFRQLRYRLRKLGVEG